MKSVVSRRTILRGGLALAGLGVAGIPEWALPLLAQGETLVPFTDIPENVRWETPPDRRTLRSPQHRWPVHAGRQIRHDAALRSPDGRSRDVQAEDLRAS